MRIALWVVQAGLAVFFFAAGSAKVIAPLDQLAETMAWIDRVPGWSVRVAGLAEVLGGIGLVAPAATRILPVLTPLAAAGLVLVMLLAAALVHAPEGEWPNAGGNLVLAALAGAVAYGRFRKYPIAPRGS